ncbi:hypothetical protein B0T16DRAFT_101773 [Cercophora newfieldiana]|uniref:Uncharacterized protein n=1 Tax=Cercophora newfieldiana TaxID=92897 RepID=A0AA39YH47_9PEZI|nr:hypothetical protein B0T16DRAFT_101773 [Cercophora newfieldiana]
MGLMGGERRSEENPSCLRAGTSQGNCCLRPRPVGSVGSPRPSMKLCAIPTSAVNPVFSSCRST